MVDEERRGVVMKGIRCSTCPASVIRHLANGGEQWYCMAGLENSRHEYGDGDAGCRHNINVIRKRMIERMRKENIKVTPIYKEVEWEHEKKMNG